MVNIKEIKGIVEKIDLGAMLALGDQEKAEKAADAKVVAAFKKNKAAFLEKLKAASGTTWKANIGEVTVTFEEQGGKRREVVIYWDYDVGSMTQTFYVEGPTGTGTQIYKRAKAELPGETRAAERFLGWLDRKLKESVDELGQVVTEMAFGRGLTFKMPGERPTKDAWSRTFTKLATKAGASPNEVKRFLSSQWGAQQYNRNASPLMVVRDWEEWGFEIPEEREVEMDRCNPIAPTSGGVDAVALEVSSILGESIGQVSTIHELPDGGTRYVVKVAGFGVVNVTISKNGLVTTHGAVPPSVSFKATSIAKGYHKSVKSEDAGVDEARGVVVRHKKITLPTGAKGGTATWYNLVIRDKGTSWDVSWTDYTGMDHHSEVFSKSDPKGKAWLAPAFKAAGVKMEDSGDLDEWMPLEGSNIAEDIYDILESRKVTMTVSKALKEVKPREVLILGEDQFVIGADVKEWHFSSWARDHLDMNLDKMTFVYRGNVGEPAEVTLRLRRRGESSEVAEELAFYRMRYEGMSLEEALAVGVSSYDVRQPPRMKRSPIPAETRQWEGLEAKVKELAARLKNPDLDSYNRTNTIRQIEEIRSHQEALMRRIQDQVNREMAKTFPVLPDEVRDVLKSVFAMYRQEPISELGKKGPVYRQARSELVKKLKGLPVPDKASIMYAMEMMPRREVMEEIALEGGLVELSEGSIPYGDEVGEGVVMYANENVPPFNSPVIKRMVQQAVSRAIGLVKGMREVRDTKLKFSKWSEGGQFTTEGKEYTLEITAENGDKSTAFINITHRRNKGGSSLRSSPNTYFVEAGGGEGFVYYDEEATTLKELERALNPEKMVAWLTRVPSRLHPTPVSAFEACDKSRERRRAGQPVKGEKGKGRGLGVGQGEGPVGRHAEEDLEEAKKVVWTQDPSERGVWRAEAGNFSAVIRDNGRYWEWHVGTVRGSYSSKSGQAPNGRAAQNAVRAAVGELRAEAAAERKGYKPPKDTRPPSTVKGAPWEEIEEGKNGEGSYKAKNPLEKALAEMIRGQSGLWVTEPQMKAMIGKLNKKGVTKPGKESYDDIARVAGEFISQQRKGKKEDRERFFEPAQLEALAEAMLQGYTIPEPGQLGPAAGKKRAQREKVLDRLDDLDTLSIITKMAKPDRDLMYKIRKMSPEQIFSKATSRAGYTLSIPQQITRIWWRYIGAPKHGVGTAGSEPSMFREDAEIEDFDIAEALDPKVKTVIRRAIKESVNWLKQNIRGSRVKLKSSEVYEDFMGFLSAGALYEVRVGMRGLTLELGFHQDHETEYRIDSGVNWEEAGDEFHFERSHLTQDQLLKLALDMRTIWSWALRMRAFQTEDKAEFIAQEVRALLEGA